MSCIYCKTWLECLQWIMASTIRALAHLIAFCEEMQYQCFIKSLTFSSEPRPLNGVRLVVDWIEDETSRKIVSSSHQLLKHGSWWDMLRPLTLVWRSLWLLEPRLDNLNRFILFSLSVVIRRFLTEAVFYHGQQPGWLYKRCHSLLTHVGWCTFKHLISQGSEIKVIIVQ